jgi:hypothetical protein
MILSAALIQAMDATFKHARVASHLSSSTRLELTLTQVQSWLWACEKDHSRCIPARSDYIPPILLDVMSGNADMIRLVSSFQDEYLSGCTVSAI